MTRFFACLGCAVACCLPAPGIVARAAGADEARCVLPGLRIRAARETIVIRTKITIQGRPVAAFWDGYFADLFARLDRNDDGLLDRDEAARLPHPDCLQAEFRGDFDNVTAMFAPLADLDRSPADGTVTSAELAQYLRTAGVGAGELRVAPTPGGLDLASARGLFDLLASEKATWDRTCLDDAYARLRRLDADDDQRVSLAELRLASGSTPGRDDAPRRESLFEALPGADAAVPGSVELTIELDASQPSIAGSSAAGKSVATTAGICDVGAARIKLQALDGHGSADFRSARQSLWQQFEADDLDKNQVLDRGEAERSAHSGYFMVLLAVADRNADGRLSMPELNRHLDFQAAAVEHCVVVSARDHGSSLPAILDTDGDERLTLRELRHGWPRLAAWDRNADGALSWDEVPQEYQLTWSIGRPQAQPAVAAVAGDAPAAPRWFQSLDRNGDGDLSRREFPGTLAEFRRWDADGDGLVSLVEARSMPKH